ncbi:hypothetical protein FLONG3_3618 [Fusarium longipes]|uniref:Uncharacterized protein n=1 Tax=Fusarium longipes TaxID=694270 RepID=A0A395T0M9_9HYPO|nr:hypothetical protein FLONG3_3618 [Fusarium longipes]
MSENNMAGQIFISPWGSRIVFTPDLPQSQSTIPVPSSSSGQHQVSDQVRIAGHANLLGQYQVPDQAPILGHANAPHAYQVAEQFPVVGHANAPPPYIPDQVPVVGHTNAPPPYQGPNQPLYQSRNHSRVTVANWPCSSFSYVKPTTYQQFTVGVRMTDASKERLERELFHVRKTLRSFRVSDAEFEAALTEYAAIRHEMLELELRQACSRRAWRVIEEEYRERLLREQMELPTSRLNHAWLSFSKQEEPSEPDRNRDILVLYQAIGLILHDIRYPRGHLLRLNETDHQLLVDPEPLTQGRVPNLVDTLIPRGVPLEGKSTIVRTDLHATHAVGLLTAAELTPICHRFRNMVFLRVPWDRGILYLKCLCVLRLVIELRVTDLITLSPEAAR